MMGWEGVYIKEEGGSYGVYARGHIEAGEVALELSPSAPHLDKPTRTSIRVGNRHVEDSVGAYINHSCDPSCLVAGRRIVAVRPIHQHEEITFNYLEHEGELASPFYCSVCCEEVTGRGGPPCKAAAGGDK